MKYTASGSHVNAALDILAGDEAEELLAKRQRKERLDRGEDEDEDIPDDGMYRGQAAYKSHIKKSSEIPKAMRVGPQRNTSTIRTVTIVDYQPDVCKDYKGVFFWFFQNVCLITLDLQKLVIAVSEILVNSCMIVEHVSIHAIHSSK